MQANLTNVPNTLRELSQWIVWKTVKRDGDRPTKVPFQINGRTAKVNDPTTWSTFNEASATFEQGGYDGIGFMFSADDEFCGIDLDGCRDVETGKVEPWAKDIIVEFDTYTEVSPSQTGAKMFFKGKLPFGGRKKDLLDVDKVSADKTPGIEVYDQRRYFAITGLRMNGPAEPQERQELLTSLCGRYWPEQHAAPPVDFDSSGAVVDRARKYLAKVPPAVSGSSGHNDTFHAACVLVCGFSLAKEEALQVLAEWNETCQPPWSEKELAHKIDGAFEQPGERGYLLNTNGAKASGSGHKSASTKDSETDRGDFYRLTDVGNAKRLVSRNGKIIRYCHRWKQWLIWNEARWEPDESGEIVRRAKNTIAAIYDDVSALDDNARKAMVGHAMKSERRERLNAMIALAESEPGIPISPDKLDQDGWLLNCPNGTIDLKTGDLLPHRRSDFITKMCLVEFDPDAACPIWEEALLKIFAGSSELVGYFQRAMGLSILGVVRDEVLFIPHGSGSNAKSLVLGTVQNVLGGDFCMKAPPDLLMKKKYQTHATERADLFGKRLVLAIETEDGQRLGESLVKELTGRDKIRARRLYENHWEFTPQHTIWLACNHLPNVRGTDHAIWRRLRVVPFSVQFWNEEKGETGPPELKADKALDEKFLAEQQGILAWLVRGSLNWQSSGLAEPDSVKAATSKYRNVMDTLGAFVTECCVVSNAAESQAGDLYEQYKYWMKKSGERATTQTRFGLAMVDRGFNKDRVTSGDQRGRQIYVGIGVKQDWIDQRREDEQDTQDGKRDLF